MTHNDEDNVRKIVRDTRKSFLLKHSNPVCQYDLLLSISFIKDNINNLGERLKVNTTTTRNKTLSDEKTLKIAGEMFTYLNSCPPSRLLSFYRDLFNVSTSREIILASTSLLKSSQNFKKRSTLKILVKIMKNMNLTQFEDIQKVTQGICYKNGAFEKCSNEIYNENILGLYQVHMKLWSSSICEIHSNFELDTTVKL